MPVEFARFATVLGDLGVAGQVRELPESAPTAAAAAAQLGCELGAIANSLVFSADGAPLLVMTSGAHRVDTVKIARLTGVAEVRRADARSVRDMDGPGHRRRRPGRSPQPDPDPGGHLAGQVRRDLGRGGPPAHRIPHLLRRTPPHHRRHPRRRRRLTVCARAASRATARDGGSARRGAGGGRSRGPGQVISGSLTGAGTGACGGGRGRSSRRAGRARRPGNSR